LNIKRPPGNGRPFSFLKGAKMKKIIMMLSCVLAAGIVLTGCGTAQLSKDELAALAKVQKSRIMLEGLITEPPYILELAADGTDKQLYSVTLNGQKIMPKSPVELRSAQGYLDSLNEKLAEGVLIILDDLPTGQTNLMPPGSLEKIKAILASSKSKYDKVMELNKMGLYFESSNIVNKNK
jgi:hypothetical protein